MDYIKFASEAEEYIIQMRRHLHEHPELSGRETETIKFIEQELEKIGLPYKTIFPGGVVAFADSGRPGKTVLLRADIDALPMQESDTNLKNKKNCVSRTPGVSHTCGHDAHTAMLLGAAKIIKEQNIVTSGRALLLFEQGEEATSDVVNVLEYFEREGIKPDRVFGIHTAADLASGFVAVPPDRAQGGMADFKIEIVGKSASRFEKNPDGDVQRCFAAIHADINSFRVRCVSAHEPFTYSVCTLKTSGESPAFRPNLLEFSGSARFFETATADKFLAELEARTRAACAIYGCEYRLCRLTKCLPSLINHKPLAEVTAREFKALLGESSVVNVPPSLGSETFAFLSSLYPATFCYLGIKNEEIGTGAPHHNPQFDVDESCLKFGTAMYLAFLTGTDDGWEEKDFIPTYTSIHELLNDNDI